MIGTWSTSFTSLVSAAGTPWSALTAKTLSTNGIRMPDKAWKAAERRLAKMLGAERNSLSGSNSKLTASDSTHPTLYLESKQRERHAVWALYKDTRTKALKENKTPALGLFQKNCAGVIFCIHSDDMDAFIAAWQAANDVPVVKPGQRIKMADGTQLKS